MQQAQPVSPTILVTGVRAPAALYAARLFHLAGARVIAADSACVPLSRADKAHYETRRFPSPNGLPEAFRTWLLRTCEEERPELIFCCCEEIFHVRTVLAASAYADRLFAPDTELLFRSHSKAEFPKLLSRAGLASPHTRRIETQTDMRALGPELAQLVIKPEFSRFATEALVRPPVKEIENLTPTKARAFVAQEALSGEEICSYAIARDGRLRAFCAYRSLYRAGQGAGTYFEPVEMPEVEAYVQRFAEVHRWTGQLAFDLIVTDDRGPIAIECNPRVTSGVHLFQEPGAFLMALMGEGGAVPSRDPAMVSAAVALYGGMDALRTGRLREWRADMARAREATRIEGFTMPLAAMLKAMGLFAIKGWRAGVSPAAAATWDIEWNGPASLGTGE